MILSLKLRILNQKIKDWNSTFYDLYFCDKLYAKMYNYSSWFLNQIYII